MSTTEANPKFDYEDAGSTAAELSKGRLILEARAKEFLDRHFPMDRRPLKIIKIEEQLGAYTIDGEVLIPEEFEEMHPHLKIPTD